MLICTVNPPKETAKGSISQTFFFFKHLGTFFIISYVFGPGAIAVNKVRSFSAFTEFVEITVYQLFALLKHKYK